MQAFQYVSVLLPAIFGVFSLDVGGFNVFPMTSKTNEKTKRHPERGLEALLPVVGGPPAGSDARFSRNHFILKELLKPPWILNSLDLASCDLQKNKNSFKNHSAAVPP